MLLVRIIAGFWLGYILARHGETAGWSTGKSFCVIFGAGILAAIAITLLEAACVAF